MKRYLFSALLLTLTGTGAHAQSEGSLADQILDLSSQVFPGQRIELAEDATPPDGLYARALYDGYIKLSRVEYEEGDYSDSDVFADRALASIDDAIFEPEAISARDLPTALLNAAATHRRNLLVAQLRGARTLAPSDAAEAQVSFDCWMQEQEEDRQFEDIALCVERFEMAMKAINTAIAAHEAALAQKNEEPPELPRLISEVFFDLNSAELSPESLALIEDFAGWVKQYYTNPTISVVGNSDQSGGDLYVDEEGESFNLKLSRERAQAVADQLAVHGIVVDGVFARGDGVPAIINVERGPERLNRRVEMIALERN